MLVYRLWFFFFHPFVLHISYCVFLLLSFLFVCLFCLWEGAWLTRSYSGRGAFVSSLRRENSISDWEGCGVTNDINERLMQTHINLVFLSLSQIPIFLKVIWSFDNDETILNKFGVFLVKILGVGKNELQLWKSSVFAK